MTLGFELDNPNIRQEGDVLLVQTLDNGEISVFGGVVIMSGGLATSAFICLFGGNFDDPGESDSNRSWWGNFGEDEDRHIRSRVQHLLGTIPPNSANLRRMSDAAKSDLEGLIEAGAASSIEVSTSMPGLNKVKFTIRIDGNESLEFTANWSVEL